MGIKNLKHPRLPPPPAPSHLKQHHNQWSPHDGHKEAAGTGTTGDREHPLTPGLLRLTLYATKQRLTSTHSHTDTRWTRISGDSLILRYQLLSHPESHRATGYGWPGDPQPSVHHQNQTVGRARSLPGGSRKLLYSGLSRCPELDKNQL